MLEIRVRLTENARRRVLSSISWRALCCLFQSSISDLSFCFGLQDKFNTAAEDVKKLTKRPSNEEMLEIYGLYKQATAGDNTTSQPWAIQLEASAKWNAWKALEGTQHTCSRFSSTGTNAEIGALLQFPTRTDLFFLFLFLHALITTGTSKEAAMEKYVEAVTKLQGKYA